MMPFVVVCLLRPMNRARFIATLGSSSTDLKIISKMVEHGVTSFRLNTYVNVQTGSFFSS